MLLKNLLLSIGQKVSVNLNLMSEAVRRCPYTEVRPTLKSAASANFFRCIVIELLTFLTNPNDSKRYDL